MEKEQFIEHLIKMGLTRQEATIYNQLLKSGKQTGYEIAKATGISRSNAYSALSSLVDKGAAYMVEETAKKYIPVMVEEFCDNYIRRMMTVKEWLLQNQPQEKADEEGYITIEGAEHIFDKAQTLLSHVEARVYISGNTEFVELLKSSLKEVIAENKKVVIVTDTSYTLQGAKVYISEDKGKQVGVIVDSKYILTGEYGINSTNTCLYSGQKNLVALFKNALGNEIKLINVRRTHKR